MTTSQQLGDPLKLAERLLRIGGRAARAHELHTWGLNPQDTDPGSSLTLDDEGFMLEFDGHVIRDHAFWPVATATDNLATAAQVFTAATQSRQLHAASVMTLCRSALETSARTIWLLSDTDPEVRRSRCVAVMAKEMEERKWFDINEGQYLKSGQISAPAEQAAKFDAHLAEQTRLRDIAKAARTEPAPGFTKTIEKASEWIDANVPAHDSGELAMNGMSVGAKRFYSLGSSFVHGYKWAVDYARDGHLFSMLADGFAASVNMTECAIALIEAQAQRPNGKTDREYHYPKTLAPTVREWSKLYNSVQR